MPSWLKRWIPTREQILANRALAPFAGRLRDERLWRADRRSVAIGVSIGLFFGLMIPFAQFLFAILTALWLRAHLVTSATCTLVSNPLTFTPIYWGAYELGRFVLARPAAPDEVRQVEHSADRIGQMANTGWLEGLWLWIGAAGVPLLTGLFIMACSAAAIGYLAVHLLWRERRG